MKKSKNKNYLRVALLVGTVVSLYFVPWLLVKAWILPLPDTVQEQMEQAIDLGFDGMLVYIDQEGQAPQSYAAGYHNRDQKIPAQPQALFKIASISKLYDAVAVTKLVHAGRLSLDETLAHYLPELTGRIQYADAITLKQLIQHKSGIPNFTDSPNFWAAPTGTYEESLALILDQPALFEPGEDYAYCNTNYLLLNKIMDNTLGYDNFRFIEQEILKPLQLHDTYGTLGEVDLDRVMSGYHVGHPHDLKTDEHGMVASAADVGKFIRALNTGTVFQGGEQDLYSSIYEYEHGGWVPGYQSFASYHLDKDAVLVAFYSTTDSKLYNWNLSEIINNRLVKLIGKRP